MKQLRLIMAVFALGTLHSVAAFSQTRDAATAHSSDVRPFLQRFVNTYSKRAVDYFFVSAEVNENGGKFVYAYWVTGNAILIVDIADFDDEDLEFYGRKGRVDLLTEIVPTIEDVGGSNHLTSVDDIQQMLQQCVDGRTFVVKRRANKALKKDAR